MIPSISKAFRTVVAATEAAIIADNTIDWGTLPKKVYFMHGHPKEIVKVLHEYTSSPSHGDKKYPLVALFRDIKENLSIAEAGNLSTSFNARFIICTLTTPDKRADDREQSTFDPILIPIFNHLVTQLSQSVEFGWPSIQSMEIIKWDRYFWGTQELDKNILNDYVDAIEVEQMKLKLFNRCSNLSIKL